MTKIIIVMNLIIIIAIAAMIIKDILSNIAKKKYQPYKYNHKNSKMFMNTLDQMIEYETAYVINVKFGEHYIASKDVNNEIPNSELSDVTDGISSAVINDMSDIMKTYLYNSFGQSWIHNYVIIKTLSLVTKLSSEIITG